MRKHLLAHVVEDPDDGFFPGGVRSRIKIGLVALALAVIHVIALDIDDVRDMGGHGASRRLRFNLEIKILIQSRNLCIILLYPFALKLLEKT